MQRERIENLMIDDSAYTASGNNVHQAEQAVHSGDESAQPNSVDLSKSATAKPYEKALSQFAQLNEPFPLNEKPRRISE